MKASSNFVFNIDPKHLQLRWTDIEIRKYAMPIEEDQDEDEEQLPPLTKEYQRQD